MTNIHSRLQEPKIISIPITVLVAIGGAGLSFWGSTQRPELVPDPALAAVATSICLFALLFPFTQTKRDLWEILSPEVMGGMGYLFFIGVAAVTNHTWPGYAVNPSLFGYLPPAIAAQTAAALAFWGGAAIARRWGLGSPGRETDPDRLALVMLVCAVFTFYVSLLMPRANLDILMAAVRAGESVSWTLTVGVYIVLQSLPMLIAAWIYLREARFLLARYTIMAVFGFALIQLLVSGSRIYAAQIVLLLLVAYMIAQRKFEKRWGGLVIALSVILLIANTVMRLSGTASGNINPSVVTYNDIVERARSLQLTATGPGFQDVIENLHENIVYHLSDNQTMAMIIRNSDRGALLGEASLNSLLSGLPRELRPAGYRSATDTIMYEFRFYKEAAADAPYWPDWQMTVGVLGFADFWLPGLVAFPFVVGVALRWLYNKTVLTTGLGQAGWLLYVPMVLWLWNPTGFGPDSTQTLRLLIPLALALRWATREKAFEHSPQSFAVSHSVSRLG